MIRIDHELGQGARLAARCAAEPCSVRKCDRLRLLLIGLLHNKLLWCWLRASNAATMTPKKNGNWFLYVNLPLGYLLRFFETNTCTGSIGK